MNKSDVIESVSQKSGFSTELCGKVMDAVEEVSGSVLIKRMKGEKLDESDAVVAEIAQKTQLPESDCREILKAFEETFGEGIAEKFRFFKK